MQIIFFAKKIIFFFENNQENNENQKIEKNDSFIACQAPLFFTRSQFWSMIWDENSSVIVMLTDLIENGKSKADIYWPTEINNWVEFSEVAVLLRKVQFRNDIVIRHLSLKKNDEFRNIIHLQYVGWPDFGTPSNFERIQYLISLLDMRKEQGKSRGLFGPSVIHCSAGIGRTGSFIAILHCLEKIKLGIQDLDMMNLVLNMRKYRSGLVQTTQQYKFIYDFIEHIQEKSKTDLNGIKISLSWEFPVPKEKRKYLFCSMDESEFRPEITLRKCIK